MTTPADPRVAIQALQDYAEALRSVTWLAPVSSAEMNQRDRWLADEIDKRAELVADQIAALEAERAQSTEGFDSLRHEIAQFRSALREYGKHKPDCHLWTCEVVGCGRAAGMWVNQICTCGLAAILAPLEATDATLDANALAPHHITNGNPPVS